MFLNVESAKHLGDYELLVHFSNGATKVVNLVGELHGEIFEPLKDVSFFQRAMVNPETNTVEWPNGADFAPEFLFEIGQETQQVA